MVPSQRLMQSEDEISRSRRVPQVYSSTIINTIRKKCAQLFFFLPQSVNKKELVELAYKNAKIALGEKFYLIERDEERTRLKSAVELLGEELGIAALKIGLKHLIIQIFKEQNPVS